MTQRERHAGGTPPKAERLPLAASTRNGDVAPRWEELFPALPPAQQRFLLSLAAEHGIVNARQIPSAYGATDHARSFFAPLFQGQSTDHLPAATLSPIDLIDTALNEEQRSAVAKAVHTPDVCLIRGLPGTGKSRVIAEIVRQAVRLGQRVLLTAPTPAALDVVLQRLIDDSHVLPLRCLGSDEHSERLPPAIAKMTFAASSRQLGEEAVAHARRTATDATARLNRLESDAAVLNALSRLADRLAELPAMLAECEAKLANVEAEVLADAELGKSERLAHDTAIVELDAALARADADIQKAAGDLAEATTCLEKLLPLADDRQNMRFLSKNFWKSFSEADLAKRIDDAKARQTELQKLWTDAKDARERLANKRVKAIEDGADRQRQLIADETQRRRSECESRKAECQRNRDEVLGEWNRTLRELSPESPLPPDPIALAAARAPNEKLLDAARREEEFGRRWADALADHAAELPTHLLNHVNLVAATISAQSTDAQFAELSRRGPFDLLILDEAHRLTDVEYYPIARRASRWVLVGEPVSEAPTREPEREEPHRDRDRRGGAATMTRPKPRAAAKVFALPKLWHSLHCETWRIDDGRVRCQLRPLAPMDRDRLESESVADDPDTELRILAPEAGAPALVEVVFPPATAIERAKVYLYRELNELPVPTCSARWDETPQRWVYRLSSAPATKNVELEPGLRELFRECAGCWHTVAFEFDRAAWTRERADVWTGEFLRSHDPARTAALTTPHRMRPALANFVSALCFESGYAFAPSPPTGVGHPVEFIPVPGLSGDGGRRRGHHEGNGYARKLPPMRGGAGFELDISDARNREHIPPDLRPLLPERGFVNLPEAHAIIRLLESMLPSTSAKSVAVLPLCAAQAELIRAFVRNSPIIAKSAVALSIEAAMNFRQRDCDVAIIGLTRSHTHRAVPYGDDPGAMHIALTRAGHRVIVVGDPGTLTRRSQWDGPLDHLDAATANREKAWVADLIRQLSGHGSPSSIHLLEGPP